MNVQSRLFGRARGALAAAVAATIMAGSLGVGIASSGASSTMVVASPSAFCSTLYSFHAKAPTGTNAKSYHTWAKTYLPLFEKLAAEAPSAGSKRVLNQLVTVLKYEASSSNLKQLAAYIAANHTHWVNGWKAFASDVLTCLKSLY